MTSWLNHCQHCLQQLEKVMWNLVLSTGSTNTNHTPAVWIEHTVGPSETYQMKCSLHIYSFFIFPFSFQFHFISIFHFISPYFNFISLFKSFLLLESLLLPPQNAFFLKTLKLPPYWEDHDFTLLWAPSTSTSPSQILLAPVKNCWCHPCHLSLLHLSVNPTQVLLSSSPRQPSELHPSLTPPSD